MKKGDLDYRIMKSLDMPIGNTVPILHSRSGNLSGNLKGVRESRPNFQSIADDEKVFSEVYNRVVSVYARLQRLDENIREQHGKSVIEGFWQILSDMKDPKRILKESIKRKDVRKIKEVAGTLYKSACDLLSLSCDFGDLPLYRQYRDIRYAQ